MITQSGLVGNFSHREVPTFRTQEYPSSPNRHRWLERALQKIPSSLARDFRLEYTQQQKIHSNISNHTYYMTICIVLVCVTHYILNIP